MQHTEPVQMPVKRGGKRPFFSPQIEDEIARRYFDKDEPGRSLALEFAPLAPFGKLSEAGIRAIAKRARQRLMAKGAA